MRVVAAGLQFPEGPIAMADGSVLVVEIAGQSLCRISPNGAVEVVARAPGGPNGAAVGPDGRIYICSNGALRLLGDGSTCRPVGPAGDYRGGSIDRRGREVVRPMRRFLAEGSERPRLRCRRQLLVHRSRQAA